MTGRQGLRCTTDGAGVGRGTRKGFYTLWDQLPFQCVQDPYILNYMRSVAANEAPA